MLTELEAGRNDKFLMISATQSSPGLCTFRSHTTKSARTRAAHGAELTWASGTGSLALMAVAAEPTVADLVRARAGDGNVALTFEGQTWTWAEVVGEMEMRADRLRRVVTTDPPHVGVLLENTPEFAFLLGAAALSGHVIVGLNLTRRGEELARDIRHADCAVVLTEPAHAELLEGLDLGVARVRFVDDLSELNELNTPAVEPRGPTADDLLLLLFTSGSSGAPKAVRVTQGRVARAAGAAMGFTPDDVLYCAMPLFHGNALMSSVFPALGAGAGIALKRKFSASEFLPDVREHECTFFSTVGRALSYILATPEQPDDADNPLRVVLAPESSSTDQRRFRKRFATIVVAGYGSSENAIIMIPKAGIPRDALGVPLEGQDIAIIDPESQVECPPARFDADGKLLNADVAIGEIVGRNVVGGFEGYYNNPDATRERVRDGWYWSGDLGYRTDDGVFFFAGRTADWLRVDGENFAAAPVERIIERFMGVAGAAVYGVPDERTIDDQVMVALELVAGVGFDPDAFDAFLDSQRDLSTKWRPRYVRLVTALPVGATTKIDKKPLRRNRWDVIDPIHWRRERRGPLTVMTDDDRAELRSRFAEHGRDVALAGGSA
jgi:fatty-acyl-CoA synthase